MSRIALFAIALSSFVLTACDSEETADTGPAQTTSSATGTYTGTVEPDICDSLGLTRRAWQDGGDAENPKLKTLVADFTIKTTEGPWTLSENWTGCETFLFIPSVPNQASGWPTPLWDRDHRPLIRNLPDNAHVFFISSETDWKTYIDPMIEEMTSAIDAQTNADDLRPRVHFVKKGVTEQDNWVEQYLRSPGWGFGIDRFQKLRDIGSFADAERYNSSYGWFEPNLSHASHEAIYYNFESDRIDDLEADDAFVVETFTGEVINDSGWSGVRGWVEIDLPDAATMAQYDGLTIDMDMTCDGDGEYGTCPAWDRITHLYICDQDLEPTGAWETEACQPYEAQIDGICAYDGIPDGTACGSEADCPTTTGTAAMVTCDGVVPSVSADTQVCPCADVMNQPYDGSRSCTEDGLGFGECNCSCNTELNRWITTYHREGAWDNDAHHALPWFQRGGKVELSYYSIDPWGVDIDLRFTSSGASELPTETYPLFTGGTFDSSYNDKYDPIEIDVPANASKVQLAVIISGHGMSAQSNCAEFCNTEHRFFVNGEENLVEFDYLNGPDTTEWCQNDVENGTVPNQYGTWFYARSNWCPGKEVAPIYIDITSQVTPGATNTFEYTGLRNGVLFSESGASISLSSFVTVFE